MPRFMSRILVASALLAPVSALAVPVTIDFTVTARGFIAADTIPGASYAGFGPGTLGGGFVTFDDSLGTTSDLINGLPVIDARFDWLGNSFTGQGVSLMRLQFDSLGNLTSWGMASTEPRQPGCWVNCMSFFGGPTYFMIRANAPNDIGAPNDARIHIDGFVGAMYGDLTWSLRTASVPEPATLGMFGFGLLGVALARRRRPD